MEQVPRVAGAVGDFVDRFEFGVERRFAFERSLSETALRLDADGGAAREPLIDVGLIVAGAEHEKAAGRLNRLRRDPPHDLVLVDALFGALGVADGVAPAGVQQPVIAPAGPGGEVAHLGEDDANTTQRQIPRQPRAGRAAADD